MHKVQLVLHLFKKAHNSSTAFHRDLLYHFSDSSVMKRLWAEIHLCP